MASVAVAFEIPNVWEFYGRVRRSNRPRLSPCSLGHLAQPEIGGCVLLGSGLSNVMLRDVFGGVFFCVPWFVCTAGRPPGVGSFHPFVGSAC